MEENPVVNSSLLNDSILCVDANIEEFPNFMVHYLDQHPEALLVPILMVLYLVLALGIVCDDYFVPSLEVVCDKLHLSPDVAGEIGRAHV